MSIRARLDDARVLYAAGRVEGCLLSVLVAVAATSRKRYPREQVRGDGEAFKRFLCDEMLKVTGCVKNLNVMFRGRTQPLQDVLYHCVRCELAHEGHMPDDFVLEPGPGLRIDVNEKRVVFTDPLLDGLGRAVAEAPENLDEFPPAATKAATTGPKE